MTKTTFLNFEQPIAELDGKIEELRFVQDDSAVDISEEIDRLAEKPAADQRHLRQADAVAVSQIARHPHVHTPWTT
jgi:acetyl-CoA carboxylase carboxyl transferase subunit alpha